MVLDDLRSILRLTRGVQAVNRHTYGLRTLLECLSSLSCHNSHSLLVSRASFKGIPIELGQPSLSKQGRQAYQISGPQFVYGLRDPYTQRQPSLLAKL